MIKLVKYGPCNNKLFNAVIEILNECTNKKWGFVQTRRKVSYVTSEMCNLKFSAGVTNCKNIDYSVKTRANSPDWKQALRLEICAALLKFSRDRPELNISVTSDGVVEEYVSHINLDLCKEFNAYQTTFIHAPTDWIAKESIILDRAKPLSRDDYM